MLVVCINIGEFLMVENLFSWLFEQKIEFRVLHTCLENTFASLFDNKDIRYYWKSEKLPSRILAEYKVHIKGAAETPHWICSESGGGGRQRRDKRKK